MREVNNNRVQQSRNNLQRNTQPRNYQPRTIQSRNIDPRNNQRRNNQQPKRKITGLSKETKKVFLGAAATALIAAIGIGTIGGVYAHKKEVVLDHAAEQYVNAITRNELNAIASGYSPEQDRVISDRYEIQRSLGNDLIRDIAGLEGLYKQNPKDVTLQDYQDLAAEYKEFVKEFVWDNIGQYYYSESDRDRFVFFQDFDNSDGTLEYCMALDRYSHSDNEYSNSLYVTDRQYIEKNDKCLYALVRNYVNVLQSEDINSLRRNLNNAQDIINDVVDQMYYIDDKGIIHELPVQKVQDHAIDEIQDGDYTTVRDVNGGTKVILTDIHGDDER